MIQAIVKHRQERLVLWEVNAAVGRAYLSEAGQKNAMLGFFDLLFQYIFNFVCVRAQI